MQVQLRRKGDKLVSKFDEMVMATPLHSIRSVTSDLPASPISLSTAQPAAGGEVIQVRSQRAAVAQNFCLTFQTFLL